MIVSSSQIPKNNTASYWCKCRSHSLVHNHAVGRARVSPSSLDPGVMCLHIPACLLQVNSSVVAFVVHRGAHDTAATAAADRSWCRLVVVGLRSCRTYNLLLAAAVVPRRLLPSRLSSKLPRLDNVRWSYTTTLFAVVLQNRHLTRSCHLYYDESCLYGTLTPFEPFILVFLCFSI